MSAANRTCIIKEFPLPEREYRVAPARCWDAEVKRTCSVPHRRRKKGRRVFLPFLLLGLALFCLGFRLGRAASAREPLSQAASSVPVSLLPAGGGRTDGVMPEAPVSGGPEEPVRTAPDPEPSSGDSWNLILVNQDHPLPEDFTIPELTQLANGHAVDSRVYPALQRMMDDARAAGLSPTICSSYRTWDRQEELYGDKVQRLLAEGYTQEEAGTLAAAWVARPGASEHQTGLAVDIVDKSYQLLDRGQEDTAVQKWLMAHCAEYGFILRYPAEKSALTGVNYEPWHYRYVGTQAAGEMMERGICLEEYLLSG